MKRPGDPFEQPSLDLLRLNGRVGRQMARVEGVCEHRAVTVLDRLCHNVPRNMGSLGSHLTHRNGSLLRQGDP